MQLTILTPTYRRRKHLLTQLSTTIPDNAEWIVAITDGYRDLPKLVRQPNKIVYIQDRLTIVYSQLIDLSTTEYIHVVEDDDYLLPEYELIFPILQQNKYDLLVLSYYDVDDDPIIFDIKAKTVQELILEIHSKYYEDFQFGQLIFRKSILKAFPYFESIFNDFLFLTCLLPSATVYPVTKPVWKQGHTHDRISSEFCRLDTYKGQFRYIKQQYDEIVEWYRQHVL